LRISGVLRVLLAETAEVLGFGAKVAEIALNEGDPKVAPFFDLWIF
jgi:hypothetical protein